MPLKHPDQLAAQRWCSDQIRSDLKAGRSMLEFPIHDIENKARADMEEKNTKADLLTGGGNIFQVYYHDNRPGRYSPLPSRDPPSYSSLPYRPAPYSLYHESEIPTSTAQL